MNNDLIKIYNDELILDDIDFAEFDNDEDDIGDDSETEDYCLCPDCGYVNELGAAQSCEESVCPKCNTKMISGCPGECGGGSQEEEDVYSGDYNFDDDE